MKQFDKHADAYNVVRGKIAYPDSLYRNLAERAPAREAALDIGCGNGVSTVRLQPWFRYVEGSDLGEALIAKARENYPEIRFSVSPAETFAPQRRFDLVTSATSFYWMDRKQVLTRMADWLTPAGCSAPTSTTSRSPTGAARLHRARTGEQVGQTPRPAPDPL